MAMDAAYIVQRLYPDEKARWKAAEWQGEYFDPPLLSAEEWHWATRWNLLVGRPSQGEVTPLGEQVILLLRGRAVMENPKEIARKLTKAQREAVELARFRERRGVFFPEGWYVSGDKRVRRNLARLGLTRDYLSETHPLTPLGLAVHTLLTPTREDQSYD